MTLAPDRPPLHFLTLEDIAAAIRLRGGRLSSARRIVLEALFAADGLVSAEYIAGGLDGQMTTSEISSVYRNLEHLEQLGVVHHVHLDHGPGLYTLACDAEYLVCERCKRVDAVPTGDLDAVRLAIRESFGYQARFSHFPIVGMCAACADRPDGRSPAGPSPAAHDQVTHAHSHGDHVHSH